MNTVVKDPNEFGKIRAFFWPIFNDELKKFLPMGMMMFFILFVYTVLRNTKDTLIVTNVGTEVLPVLKGAVVLPAAILFVILYAKLTNILSRETIFHLLVAVFIAFFGAFALYLYPNRHIIHPSPELIHSLQASYPLLKSFFPVYGVWSYSAFYVLSELWGSVMISLLFWQFANEITRTQEAKRFYAMFGLLANFALIASGTAVKYFAELSKSMPEGVDVWGVTLNYTMFAVVLSGLFVMIIYRWMNKNVLTDPKYYDAAEVAGKPKKDKPKLSVMESLKYIFTSKYLGFIAILIIAYGMSINLVEIIWKEQLKHQFPNPNDYQAFMGEFSRATGFATIALILMLKGVVKKFGWFAGAIITPVVLFVTAVVFFGFIFLEESFSPLATAFGVTSLFMAVIVGATQNIFSKATKYSLFDPTKEMAYIPLDQELKVKGKAAVDVIGGRLGKAGGGYIALGLLLMTQGTTMDIAPYVAAIVIFVILAWMFAASGLSKMYNSLIKTQEAVVKKA
jgi:AAA family ATP:ADP antiporter